MYYEKLLTINLKSNSTKISFDIKGKHSNINSNINLNIINNHVTSFSYDYKLYAEDLIIYKISNSIFEIWIELENNEEVNIFNLKYDINKCSIIFDREINNLPNEYMTKDRCILKHNNNIYERAKGTANDIILTMSELYDGYWKKFIASYDSAGSITINGKRLYKINTTTSPELKKDKPYEIYYNLSNDCFYLISGSGSTVLHSSGTALPEHVLTGKTFSNNNGTNLAGTMINNGTINKTLNCGTSYTIPKGYHNGSGKVTVNSLASQTSANATASDIISGKTAWVNGSKITGTATIQSLGALQSKSGTLISDGEDGMTINLGVKPKILVVNIPQGYYSYERYIIIFRAGMLSFADGIHDDFGFLVGKKYTNSNNSTTIQFAHDYCTLTDTGFILNNKKFSNFKDDENNYTCFY